MFIDELQELAIGLRLKRLYHQFSEAVHTIYNDNDLDFEAKYFGLFYIVSREMEVSVSEVAKELYLTHAGVIHLAADLEKRGFIVSAKSDTDSRKRILRITDKGLAALPAFEKVWNNIRKVNVSLFNSTKNNLLDAVTETEAELKKQSFLQRYSLVSQNQNDDVIIIDYNPELARYFKILNIEWINAYFSVEQHDLEQLDDPQKSVLDGGGYILFAKYNDEIVGTCALIKTGDKEFEVAKMAVSPGYRGKKIGAKLIEGVIEKAREAGAIKLWLGSNKKLAPALSLYEKFGFKHVQLQASPYSRADVRMELILT